MSAQPQSNSGSRRDFLRGSLRYACLGGVAAISATLAARSASQPSSQVCVNEGICRGCEAFEDCILPQAESVRQVTGNKPAR